MILEWLQYLTTPAPRHIRSLGLVHEAIAIEARYRRCHEAWAPHLQHSKNQILAVTSALETRDHVLVIGSGGLHDMPLRALSQTFTSVTLWDVTHLRKARRTAAAFPNVTCETVDVTGLCSDFDNWLKGYSDTPPVPDIPVNLPIEAPDLVISLNLLSQLPLQMIAKANTGKHHDLPDDFASKVMRSHIDWLRSLPCPALLLTDLERRYTKAGNIEIEDALAGLNPGIPLADWLWQVAPPGEVSHCDTIHHKVGVFLLNG